MGIRCWKNKVKKSLSQNQLSQNHQNFWTTASSYLHLNLLFSVIYEHSSYCLNTWFPQKSGIFTRNSETYGIRYQQNAPLFDELYDTGS